MEEPYLTKDVYLNRTREAVYYSMSMWSVGKQLSNLFKQSWLMLLFAELQLDVKWNNSVL